MNCDVHLADDITDATNDGDTKEISAKKSLTSGQLVILRFVPQSNIRSGVNFVRFLNVRELERVAGVLNQVAMPGELFQLCQKLVMIAAIVEQLNLA